MRMVYGACQKVRSGTCAVLNFKHLEAGRHVCYITLFAWCLLRHLISLDANSPSILRIDCIQLAMQRGVDFLESFCCRLFWGADVLGLTFLLVDVANISRRCSHWHSTKWRHVAFYRYTFDCPSPFNNDHWSCHNYTASSADGWRKLPILRRRQYQPCRSFSVHEETS